MAILHTILGTLSLTSIASAQLPSAPSLIPDPSYTGCPPDGPLLPRPTNLTQSKYLQAATDNLTAALDSALKGEIKAGWVVDNVSFSVAIVSPNGGQDHNKPLWEYHHRAKHNTGGAAQATGDSQYMIGSVSKVFSDLVLLKSGVDIQSPVTEFLPELAAPNASIQWKDITLQALADHLAGIPPNFVYEFYFLQPLHESLGFPHLNKPDYPSCGVTGLSPSCTRQEILNGLLTMDPVVPVNSKPVYSQLSFLIFSLCLEQATGKNYTQLLHETIIQPLNLTNTGTPPGDSSLGIIPPGTSSWGIQTDLITPGGGLYSSTNDLTTLLNSILSHRILSTEASVRNWLKPRSTTSSLNTLVGTPWEIQRTTNLTPDHPHTIDIYGKSGGLMGYMAQISVIDQYGIGFVVLTAGPPDSMNILYRAVTGSLLPAIESETQHQSTKYAGTWRSANVTLTTTLDSGPGLKLTALTSSSNTNTNTNTTTSTNSTNTNNNILASLQTIFKTAYTSTGFGILAPDLRIYPTELETPVPEPEARALLSQNKSTVDLVRQDWRINLDIVPLDGAAMSDLPGQQVLKGYCASWQLVDWMRYGGVPLDRVVFVIERVSGRVVGVEVPGLRGGLLGLS
ncbi:beta-lactamase/transpeptidase-like protein [Aspergillus avenaceus]|uniref:Beta-lactamase/transpeptidase-like protein n=1 Tax=Aspergillus avenaceus TaxID=36643 RepID=A0A5N6U1P5_ASPAV|nr:beta-lactamase/transpeptidase-like protein [Aspergillus avenaceus]